MKLHGWSDTNIIIITFLRDTPVHQGNVVFVLWIHSWKRSSMRRKMAGLSWIWTAFSVSLLWYFSQLGCCVHYTWHALRTSPRIKGWSGVSWINFGELEVTPYTTCDKWESIKSGCGEQDWSETGIYKLHLGRGERQESGRFLVNLDSHTVTLQIQTFFSISKLVLFVLWRYAL